ncbi:PITH domain-containing protein [Hypoxylon trugodes]|uniref:PITH domain-containing protein n=1 Tax=Hypoxylon trugodes TaxID=326681 RepID=UPI00219C3477|nr:PITH domain-containing protein [Hypoxylon trugodes]KAI1388715.1 PITH domain-containing protein [Hypoxylon trugodes]
MSHCHNEHSGYGGHNHDHHHDHVHDHSDDITPALQHSLYNFINFDGITTFNEARSGSGKAVIEKDWSECMNPLPELVSDADEQILMNVPFTGQVKLHAILLRTSPSPSAPQTLKVFINRDDLDFNTAEDLPPTQTFELSQTDEIQELPVKRALFGSVQRLTLFFEDNFSDDADDVTRLSYIGFRGEWMQLGRAPVNILYEAAPNPNDHKVRGVGVRKVGRGV